MSNTENDMLIQLEPGEQAMLRDCETTEEYNRILRSLAPKYGVDPESIELVSGVIKAAPAKKTHIFFVLDSSGSMSGIAKQTVDNFNEQLATLKSGSGALGEATLSLVTFGEYRSPDDVGPDYHSLVVGKYLGQSLDSIKPLAYEDYVPNAMTPMHDAIGYAIECANSIDDKDENTSFLMVIYTDGHENNSNRWKGKLASVVKELRETGRWTFQFMGANVDLEAARAVGLRTREFMGYEASPTGMRSMAGVMKGGTQTYMAHRAVGATAMAEGLFSPSNSPDVDISHKAETVSASVDSDQGVDTLV